MRKSSTIRRCDLKSSARFAASFSKSSTRFRRRWDRDTLIGELVDEALGLGPLERFISDPTITEIMVVDP